jgi:DNA-binding LacI/PurR family transcriptional regulator
MAVGALRELRARGLRVPEDVSVTGFDNVTLAQFCHPALTTAHIPRDLIGQTICSILLGREKTPPREFVIDPEIVLRDSTGPAPTRPSLG